MYTMDHTIRSSGPKAGPCEVNVPVCCGGVIVQAGDVVSASKEGVVVIPQRSLQDVADTIVLAERSEHSKDELLRTILQMAENLDCDLVPGPDRATASGDPSPQRRAAPRSSPNTPGVLHGHLPDFWYFYDRARWMALTKGLT